MDDAADTSQRAPAPLQQQQRRQDQRQTLAQQQVHHHLLHPQQPQHAGANSLAEQQQQSMGPAAATPEQLLSSAFRNAAMSVTQLYKDSLKLTRRAYQEGYVLALQDLVALLRERGDERSGLAVPLSDLYRFANERYAQAAVDDDATAAAAPAPSASGRPASLATPLDDGSVVAPAPEQQQHPSGETSPEHPPSQQQQQQQQAEMQGPAQFPFAPASPAPVAPASGGVPNMSGHVLRPHPHQMQHQELALNGLSLDDQLAASFLPGSFEGGGISNVPLGETRKRRYVNTGFAVPEAITLLGRTVNLGGISPPNAQSYGFGSEPYPKKGRKD